MSNSRGEEYIAWRIQWAKDYIQYGIKEGIYTPEQFEGMTDESLLAFANREESHAEYQYENNR